jgi:hypothetical protein
MVFDKINKVILVALFTGLVSVAAQAENLCSKGIPEDLAYCMYIKPGLQGNRYIKLEEKGMSAVLCFGSIDVRHQTLLELSREKLTQNTENNIAVSICNDKAGTKCQQVGVYSEHCNAATKKCDPEYHEVDLTPYQKQFPSCSA